MWCSTRWRRSWLNDLTNYHDRGDISGSCSAQCQTQGDLDGLDDVFTEKPAVVNGLVQIYSSWIRNYKLDGFRIDTVLQVNPGSDHLRHPEAPEAGHEAARRAAPDEPRARDRLERPALREGRRPRRQPDRPGGETRIRGGLQQRGGGGDRERADVDRVRHVRHAHARERVLADVAGRVEHLAVAVAIGRLLGPRLHARRPPPRHRPGLRRASLGARTGSG